MYVPGIYLVLMYVRQSCRWPTLEINAGMLVLCDGVLGIACALASSWFVSSLTFCIYGGREVEKPGGHA